jgi:predicted alternative tryptophan synthase beta-subunit
MEPIDPTLLESIFAKELIRQEVSTERFIKDSRRSFRGLSAAAPSYTPL